MFTKRKQHKIALQIARQYNLESSYLYARQQGLSPIEALEEFDLLTPMPRHTKESDKSNLMQ